jgi:hypothetical protein
MDISGRKKHRKTKAAPDERLTTYIADLTELGRTPVTVISSGCKSFLDIPRTLEYLETEGVCVGTFADGREGAVDFPAFFTRESGIRSPRTIQNEAEAAAIVCKFILQAERHSVIDSLKMRNRSFRYYLESTLPTPSPWSPRYRKPKWTS